MKKKIYQAPNADFQLLSDGDIVTLSRGNDGELMNIGWDQIIFQ